MIKFFLMHKDEVCGTLILDETTGRLLQYHDNKSRLSPFLGTADTQKMKKWWEMRAVPASRTMIQKAIRESGCLNAETYLAKNLALSMTDCYWICPENIKLKYDDVKFSNLALYNEGKIPYHNATSYDPNASLGGQMEKYWNLQGTSPLLVKESYKYYGQQSINEVFASMIHKLQNTDVPYVQYSASITEDHGVLSKCHAFTSEHVELISAYEIIQSSKISNESSLYDGYLQICIENGIDAEEIQRFMDYQTLTDFVISNTDEHLQNFGVLRDTLTMKLIGPAPIFDSGNSMFFSDTRIQPYTRAEILNLKITGFYQSEEKMLRKVQNRNIVKTDLLPSKQDVKKRYMQAGIPEEKAEFISSNYETKLMFLNEFQHGKTISFYHEKKKEQQSSHCPEIHETPKQQFILVCGSDFEGKQQINKICSEFLQKGYTEKDSASLYTVSQGIFDFDFLVDTSNLTENVHSAKGAASKTFAKIVTTDIQEELEKIQNPVNLETIKFIAENRVKIALAKGITVIFQCPSIDKTVRIQYLRIAKEAKLVNCSLYIQQTSPLPETSECAEWNQIIPYH